VQENFAAFVKCNLMYKIHSNLPNYPLDNSRTSRSFQNISGASAPNYVLSHTANQCFGKLHTTCCCAGTFLTIQHIIDMIYKCHSSLDLCTDLLKTLTLVLFSHSHGSKSLRFYYYMLVCLSDCSLLDMSIWSIQQDLVLSNTAFSVDQYLSICLWTVDMAEKCTEIQLE